MTRTEYNEYRYIRSMARHCPPTYGCQYTIPTDGTADYKNRLHALYESLNLHPASVRVDRHYFDDRERIVYIYGRTWEDNEGKPHPWTELYTADQKARFAEALR